MIWNQHNPEANYYLSEAYGIAMYRFEQAVPVRSGAQVFIVETDTGPLLLKAHTILPPENAFSLEQCLKISSKNGVTPTVMHTRDGNALLRYHNTYYAISNFFPEKSPMPRFQMRTAAGVTARMHRGMASVVDENTRSPLTVDSSELKEIFKREKFFDYLFYLDEAEACRGQVRWQLVHNDLHEGNFITSDPGRTYIVDFESISTNPLVADVFFAGFRLAGGINSRFFEFIHHYDSVNPLTATEEKYGLLFLTVDFIKKIGFILTEKSRGNRYYMKDFRKYKLFCKQAIAALEGREDLEAAVN
jgi:Ser/Thr protein kinase RdoA (MazF antagonist)